jgi:hypothetical protein
MTDVRKLVTNTAIVYRKSLASAIYMLAQSDSALSQADYIRV